MRHIFLCLLLVTSASLTACGGGLGSGSGSRSVPPVTQGNAKHLTVAFSGNTTTLAAARHTLTSGSTNVTVTFNGTTIGTGQLDSSGKATIEIDTAIPNGSTLTITAGAVSATMVWNQTAEDAAVLVQVNADGTLNVSIVTGDQPEASPAPGDPNGATETENSQGTPSSVDGSDDNKALPANLPISLTASCTSVTVTPLDSKVAAMRFEENVRDGDGGSKLKYDGPFTAAMTFPRIAQSERVEIRLFDASNDQLLDVKAPIDAFTTQSGQPTPAPCASPSA